MQPIEVTFRLQTPPSEQQEAHLTDTYDAFFGGHGDVALMTVSVDARPNSRQAVLNVASDLFTRGIVIERIEKDLVSAATIAKRCDVSRAAVGNWIRGNRMAASNFPKSYSSGTHSWRWPEVNAWLKATGKKYDMDVQYLSLEDETYIDYQLATKCNALTRDPGAWRVVHVTGGAKAAGKSQASGSQGRTWHADLFHTRTELTVEVGRPSRIPSAGALA